MDPITDVCLRRLHKLHAEFEKNISGLPPAALSWKPCPGANTIINLVWHTCRAQRFLIADTISGSTDHQDGRSDFESPVCTEEALLADLRHTFALSRVVIEKLSTEELRESRYMPKHKVHVSISWCILHAIDHTAQHLGHLEMTRRLWVQQAAGGA